MTFRRLAVAAAASIFSLCAAAACAASPSADSWHELSVDGTSRYYLVHAPQRLDSEQQPAIVLSFHGGGGAPIGMAYITKMNPAADRYGFIVVYPAGIDRHWNDGRNADDKTDDVGFITALIDELKKTYRADPKRIYATGISNGAMFSQRLACELSDKVAAIATVAGGLGAAVAPKCKLSRPIPVLMINGKSDPLVPFGGGEVVGMRGPVISAGAAEAFWALHDGCTRGVTTNLPVLDAADPTRVSLSRHTGCRAGTEVDLYSIVDGGHTWPRGVQYLSPSTIGLTSHQLDADEVIWDFFSRHPMP